MTTYILFAQIMCIGSPNIEAVCHINQQCYLVGRTATKMPLEKCEFLRSGKIE